MILRRIKGYLAARGEATFSEIVAETGESRDMVSAAIHFWVQRGDLELVTDCYEPGGAGCSVNCKGCPVSQAALGGTGACGVNLTGRSREGTLRVPDGGNASQATYRWVGAGEAESRVRAAVTSAGGTPGRLPG